MFHKRALMSFVLAAGVVVPSLCLADTLQAEAQSAASRWDEAYNGGDMDALGRLYSPDAIVVTKGTQQTSEGIQTFFSGLKSKGWDGHRTTVKSALPKDNLLIVSGRWQMTGPGEGGAKKTFEGNWVNVLERRGDGWLTVLHTWN